MDRLFLGRRWDCLGNLPYSTRHCSGRHFACRHYHLAHLSTATLACSSRIHIYWSRFSTFRIWPVDHVQLGSHSLSAETSSFRKRPSRSSRYFHAFEFWIGPRGAALSNFMLSFQARPDSMDEAP